MDLLLFEIPVYSCTLEAHAAAWEKKLAALPTDHQREWADTNQWVQWRYNEVTAWIQIFVCGCQIRGELHERTRRPFAHRKRAQKPFVCIGKLFEVHVTHKMASADVFRLVRAELGEYSARIASTKGHVDLAAFDAAASALDWTRLMAESQMPS